VILLRHRFLRISNAIEVGLVDVVKIIDKNSFYWEERGIKEGMSIDPTTDTFETSDTWTCPAGVTSVAVKCWAGGGAGGGSTIFGQPGAGGGGGAYSYDSDITVRTYADTDRIKSRGAKIIGISNES